METRRSSGGDRNCNVSLTVKAAGETDIGIVIVDHNNICVKVPSCSSESNCDFRTCWALARRYRGVALNVERCVAVASQVAN